MISGGMHSTRLRPMFNAKTETDTGLHPESLDSVRAYLSRNGKPEPTNYEAAVRGGYERVV
jgi:hypothetical protein